MWFIGVEVEQETSAPPPKKNPGYPLFLVFLNQSANEFFTKRCLFKQLNQWPTKGDTRERDAKFSANCMNIASSPFFNSLPLHCEMESLFAGQTKGMKTIQITNHHLSNLSLYERYAIVLPWIHVCVPCFTIIHVT